ncbi:MAG: hypothetical protein D6754_09565 [Alphaproteobacteria bacterium]|nr:MAG: hypothetical protein D6754_09565 [Alphaproteobacteria bacterium]
MPGSLASSISLSIPASMPSSSVEAVFLVYGEGRSYREAAEIMDCPAGTIMSRLAAARKKLNRTMGERPD